MRRLFWLPVLALGCASPAAPSAAQPGSEPVAQDKPPPGSRDAARAPDEAAANDTRPDLRTRTTGSDWPRFNGPNGDCTSPEKGILSPWPEDGLRVVWQKKTGAGYAMPAVSRGRLFMFERLRDQNRRSGRYAETGKLLGTF